MKFEKSVFVSSVLESVMLVLVMDDVCEVFVDVLFDGFVFIVLRVINVFKEIFVGVKKRVDELEKLFMGSVEKKNFLCVLLLL